MAGKAAGTGEGNKGSRNETAAEREGEMVGPSHNGTTLPHRGKTGNRLSVQDIWSISQQDANQQEAARFTST